MKMARASEQDIDAAGKLMQVLDALSSGYYPTLCESEDEDKPTFFDPNDRDHLYHLYNLLTNILDEAPGMPVRVIGGMCFVALYDKNEIFDPESDTLDLHPRLIRALELQEQLAGALENSR